MFLIETPRLLLREFSVEEDAVNAFELNNDPEVLKYTGDVAFESVEAACNFLQTYDQYQKYGYGRWATILKDTNEFIGWCGLKFMPDLNEIDLGYRLMKKFWNLGYASEAGKACVKYGFEQLSMNAIVGRADKENIASIRVLEKCGLTYYKDIDFDGHEGVCYKIEK